MNKLPNEAFYRIAYAPGELGVEYLLFLALPVPLALSLSRTIEQTTPQRIAALCLVFGTDNCINAISNP